MGILISISTSGIAKGAVDTYNDDGYDPYRVDGYIGAFDSRYVRNAIPLDQELTFDRLTSLISTQKILTIPQLIDALPTNMKDDNYVLMYRSRSLQFSSPTSPRVIIFTPTASLLLAFNGGDAGSKGANTVETIQFDRKAQRFEFHEILFDEKNPPQVSEANPSKCLSCHQSPSRQNIDMRPNWEPYAAWPGAFGSDDGMMMDGALKRSLEGRALPQDAEVIELQSHESGLYDFFHTQIVPKHPRYSRLGEFNVHATVDLAEHLQIWNLMRAVRLMREQTEIFPSYRELIRYISACNYNFYLRNNPFIQWATKQPTRKYYHYGSDDQVSKMITDIFEPLGVDTSDWSMDFGTRGRFAFYERFGTPSNTAPMLEYALYFLDSGLNSNTCDQLQSSIQTHLADFFSRGENTRLQAQHPIVPPRGEELVQQCAHCHAHPNGKIAPFIPFNQADLLSKALVSGSYKHGTLIDEIRYRTSDMALDTESMPPSLPLTAEERNALMNYFEGLAKAPTPSQ